METKASQPLVAAPGAAGEMMAWSAKEVLGQIQMIQQLMREGMKDGEHFGTIPGCGDKKVLMKAGAEKLGLMFRLAPKFDVNEKDLGGGHREITVKCSLYHINTEKFWGSGIGSCSTMETKYRYRAATRKCPNCHAEAIIKGKEEYGGGWVCFKKKGGCGSKWPDGAQEIESQAAGRQENEDIADTYNTVLKMAKKRAQVDAMITATAASDIFTQDLDEDMPEETMVVDRADPKAAAATPAVAQPKNITEAQGKELVALATAKGVKIGAVAVHAGVKRLGEITVDQLPELKKWIELQTLPKEIDKEFDAVFESLIRAGVANADLADYVESLEMDRAKVTGHLKLLIDNFKKEALPHVFLNKAEAVRKAASK